MSLITDRVIEDELLCTDKNEWFRREGIKREKLLIANYDKQCLTPVGYDLRVGRRYLKMYSRASNLTRIEEGGEIAILPHEIVAIETEEFIGMPRNKMYSGIIVSKVSTGEKGFSHISTSVDADWEGELIITLTNNTERKLVLKRKQPFCTMILFENKKPARRVCGKHPDAHITSLIEDWGLVGISPRRNWAIKISIPAAILSWPLFNYLRGGKVSEGVVALFVAISSFSFVILDRKFRTE